MADKKYDRVNWVRIGAASDDYTQITKLLYVGDRIVTPGSDGEIIPIETVNLVKPSGVSGSFKHHLIEIAIDSDNYEAMYTQDVAAVGAHYAIEDATDNGLIGYLAYQYEEDDGSTDIITYEADKIACIGKRSRYSNRPEVEFQPSVYTFVAWGNRT